MNDRIAADAAQTQGTNAMRRRLPNEPQTLDSPTQVALTQHFLLPALAELEAFFLAVRAQVDPVLQTRQPVKLGKPYPLGQCLEISLAVQKQLRSVDDSRLAGAAAQGYAAFRAFLQAGGEFRQVWGDLRGSYFQNAFQLGTLYLDVSNDTVTPTKPKVEILPFADAQFVAIRDYQHFSEVARRYWQGELHPNHVLPELAPYCPLIHVSPAGIVTLREATGYMLGLTQSLGFQPSDAILSQPPMPLALFKRVARYLAGQRGLTLAGSPEQGRQQALRHCRQYRAKRWHHSVDQTEKAIQTIGNANCVLARHSRPGITHTVLQPPPRNSANMATIKIDNQEYDLDTLSADARTQLAGIQFVDQELARLQAHVAALQTARNAYASALKAALVDTPPRAV